METLELFCLLCNTKLEVTSCVNIFYTSLPRNGTQLGSFVLQVLDCLESELRSSYVCSQCYGFFQMLEQAQWTAANIKTEILKVYESSRKRKDVYNAVADDNGKNIFEIDSKCLAKNLKNILDSETADIEECSLTGQDKLITICGEPLNEIEGTSSSVCANFKECVSRVSGRAVKVSVENSSVPTSLDNDIKNKQDVNKSRKSQAKVERQILGDADNNGENITTEDASEGILNANRGIFKEENTNDLSNNKMTMNLNRQEKMALYTHQCRTCGKLFKHTNDLQTHLLKHTGGSQSQKCKTSKEKYSAISETNPDTVQKYQKNKDSVDAMSGLGDTKRAVLINDEHGIFPEELLGMSDNDEQDDFVWKEAAVHSSKKLDKNKDGNESLQMSDTLKQVASNTQKIAYKSGRKSKYNLKPLKYSCPTCGKKWRTSTELKIHLKSHSNLRPYMCEKCGQAYKHKHALEIHVGMHNGINPFQCTFCNKCFTQKGALMRHLPMHTGETPYQCELCGKRFVHHTSYNMHALSHTGKKSYQCHVCDLSLLSTSHLKRHMRVHTGEKPFSCTLCGKRFAERYNLFAHQKIHDPSGIPEKEMKKIQHKCKQCATLFDSKQELDDHSKHHQNVVIESSRSDSKCVVIGNENEVSTGISKCYVSQSPNQNGYSVKLDARDNIIAEQSWQHIGYTKLQTNESDEKLAETQNTFQIGTNPLTLGLENQKIFMDMGYNRNLIPNIGMSNGNRISVEKTQT